MPPRVPHCSALRLTAILVLCGGAGSCLGTEPSENFTDLVIDLNEDPTAWTAGFSDVPVDREADVGFIADHRPLPESVNPNRFGLYLTGDNISDDLFMFWKIRGSGFPPGSYTVSIQLEFVSNVHAECTAGNAVSVWIKAGVTPFEPQVIEATDGSYRMNINKGEQIEAGDFLNLGDIRNGLSGCPSVGTYGVRTLPLTRQPTTVEVGADGVFWLFIGTESGFEAPHEIYFTRVGLRLLVGG